jgi:hypothetical protein
MNIAFLMFNRPELTRQVFERIRDAKPERLLVVADGAREGHPEDAAKVDAARRIVETVDWPCEVAHNYADRNMGCRRRVTTGLDWVFSQVEDAVILEDDCLPDMSFFPFCAELLERFRLDTRIAYISGNNWAAERYSERCSYHVSKVGGIWGWATWRRSWALYDDTAQVWCTCKERRVHYEVLRNARWAKAFERGMDATVQGQVDTWDYRWALSFILSPMLAVNPVVNLVGNIGFGPDGTHTQQTEAPERMRQSRTLSFPLQHPTLERDFAFERATIEEVFPEEGLVYRGRAMRYMVTRRLRRIGLLNSALNTAKRLVAGRGPRASDG